MTLTPKGTAEILGGRIQVFTDVLLWVWQPREVSSKSGAKKM